MPRIYSSATPIHVRTTARVLWVLFTTGVTLTGTVMAWGVRQREVAVEEARDAVRVELGKYPTHAQLRQLLHEERQERRADERELRAWLDERLQKLDR